MRVLALPRLSCLLLALGIAGCRSPDPAAYAPVGDMGDRSYWNARDRARPDANGRSVSFGDFSGRFLWVDYAAPWCPPCEPQARAIRDAEAAFDQGEVVFLTVMTSEMGGYGHPATAATASRWAGRFGFDPGRVLAADLTGVTIPRHLLFSPQGQLLFFKTGLMRLEEIRPILSRRIEDWQRWTETGERSRWMR